MFKSESTSKENVQPIGNVESTEKNEVGLKRTIGLSTSISLIVGVVIGSGIFISPKGVLLASNSIGACLIVWTACGIISFLGKIDNEF